MASYSFKLNINDPLTGNITGIPDPEWYTADGSTTEPVSTYIYDAYKLRFSTELNNIGGSSWETTPATNPYTVDTIVTDVGGDPTIR